MPTPQARKDRGMVYLILIGMFVQLCVIGYVYIHADDQKNELARSEKTARIEQAAAEKRARRALIKATRRGCERSKKDRIDNARFQAAQATYIHTVTGAASVKEDVKVAARKARKVFIETSSGLRKRSKIDCKAAFP